MIILDTNVVSELSAPDPAPRVVAWVANQPEADLYITAVNEVELLAGSSSMPAGRRRNEVVALNAKIIEEVLGGRVLSFDREAARQYAQIKTTRDRIGRRIQYMDCMIAAIARAHGAAVATRDISGFENCGIEIINPWES